jgi:hypothetical protein
MDTNPDAPRPDAPLWVAYQTASSAAARRELARRIVECHLGFLRLYAREHAFPYWSNELREEFLAELVIEAMRRVPTYDRLRVSAATGRTASFLTYLRPYLQETRWKMAGREASVPCGKETIRMRAAGQRFIREQLQQGLAHPSWEEVAEAIGRAHAKRLTPARAEALCRPQTVTRPDQASAGDDLTSAGWDATLGATVASAEDEALAAIEHDDRREAVAVALAAVVRTDLEADIVSQRLASEAPMTLKELASLHGVSPAYVRTVEDDLRARLRTALG